MMDIETTTSRTLQAMGWMLALMCVLLLLASTAFAQENGCIELQASAQMEQSYVDEAGRQARRLVPAGKVVPGDEVVWTITAKNVCDQPADRIVIANPVPEHMSYVADSAMGVGANIAYSLDGRDFGNASALMVREADASVRVARADEYRAIRWTYKAPFAPGATAFVRYRAIVQ